MKTINLTQKVCCQERQVRAQLQKDYKPHFFSIEEYSIFVSMAQFQGKVFRALARVVNHFEVTIYIFRSLES